MCLVDITLIMPWQLLPPVISRLVSRANCQTFKDVYWCSKAFQIIGEKNGIIIVDDYAHHPTEIAATLQAAREGWNRRVIAVFQPHRFSRTHFLLDEFSKAFKDADLVVLTDIYAPPPEQPIPGVSSAVLAEMIRQQGKAVYLISNRQDIARHLAQIVKPNDLVITMGAGPIWQTALELNDLLH